MQKSVIILLLFGVYSECSSRLELTQTSNSLGIFSEKIYKQLANESSTNFAFSPISLHAALTVLTLAAKQGSKTQQELISLVAPQPQHDPFFPQQPFLLGRADFYFRDLISLAGPRLNFRKLFSLVRPGLYHRPLLSSVRPNFHPKMVETSHRNLHTYLTNKMNFANSIWVKQSGKLNEKYKTEVSKLGVNVDKIDFTNVDAAVNKVNRWVNQTTSGFIPEMIQHLDAATQCLIVNALYATTKWTTPFELSSEKTEFWREDGSVVNITSMTREDADFLSAEFRYGGGVHKVVKIPSEDSSFELVVILPDKKTNLSAFDGKSGREALFTTLKNVQYRDDEIFVSLPKFKVESSVKATDLFKKLGVNTVFTDESELNILQDSSTLKINNIEHKAIISVDEHGAQAAAASSIGIIPLSIKIIPRFVVNRPFLVILQDSEYHLPVIMARIMDPTTL